DGSIAESAAACTGPYFYPGSGKPAGKFHSERLRQLHLYLYYTQKWPCHLQQPPSSFVLQHSARSLHAANRFTDRQFGANQHFLRQRSNRRSFCPERESMAVESEH